MTDRPDLDALQAEMAKHRNTPAYDLLVRLHICARALEAERDEIQGLLDDKIAVQRVSRP